MIDATALARMISDIFTTDQTDVLSWVRSQLRRCRRSHAHGNI